MGLLSGSALTLLFSNFVIIFIVVLGLLIYLSTRNHDFFKKRGIPYEKPLPLIGNMFKSFAQRLPMSVHYQQFYNRFPDAPVVGIFEFITPTFMIRDTEMIKQICIKDFDSFVNHRQNIDHNADPIFGRNLFAIKDQRWKDMRTILSPAFTGSKMRFLYDLIRDCAFNACAYLEKTANGKTYEFEGRDLFTRLSNDVIATSAFGLEVNSIKERDNVFYQNGRTLTNFNAFLALKFFLALNFPILINKLRIPLLDRKTSHYFRDIVLETMHHRQKSGVVRPDIIQLLLQTKAKLAENNNTGKDQIQWTDDDFVAQSVLFFLAGFDTASTLFSLMAYELAINQDIQDRLHAEIEEWLTKLDGKQPSYEDIHKMKYLDMCVQESLRKWPPAILTDRLCNKKTVIQGADGYQFTLNPGDSVEMPVFAMHRDEKYFPNPEKFDPERFSDENKDSINPFAFMPFGIGPRQCIGNRFALMECKVIFFSLLSRFRFIPNEKTDIPFQLKMGVFNNIGKNGTWLSLKLKH